VCAEALAKVERTQRNNNTSANLVISSNQFLWIVQLHVFSVISVSSVAAKVF
jgi:hypothetical protein